MKVTKLKKVKRSTKLKSGELSAVLPLSLKKKLEKSHSAGLVLFEEKEVGNFGEQAVVVTAKDATQAFKLRLAENPLDVYRSPHLLDLSRPKYQELNRYADTDVADVIGYNDLPGGSFLAKYHIFDFWDFQQSEIIGWVKKCCLWAKSSYQRLFFPPEFSPLLVGEKQDRAEKENHLEEVAPLSFILFFADFYYKIYLFLRRAIIILKLSALRAFKGDETVWLPKDKLLAEQKTSALLKGLVATSREPTISELLRPTGGPKTTSDGKFKIISSQLGRKKEVQDKYLAGNFTRKGVVPNPQPPGTKWPKDSLTWDLGNFIFSPAAWKPVAVFLGILIALTSSVKLLSYWDQLTNIKGQVMGETEQALSSISGATDDLAMMDFRSAQEKFSSANASFISAQNRLDEIKSFITVLAEIAPAENTFKSGTNIIDLGEHLSNAAGRLLGGVTEAMAESDLSLASRVKNFSLSLQPVLAELEAAQINTKKIGTSNLSGEQKDKFNKLKAALPEAVSGLKSLLETAVFAVKVLGENDVRRYLLVFQNDNELRATGGFMGSFALVDLRGGKIEKITIPEGGTYDVRAGATEAVAPPDPLRLVADRWEFQDANWWPDFPVSAKNIKWFYEKSGGPTVDGVIAVNSSFLEKLLMITGPINLPAYGKTITADNYEVELQKSIELEAKEKTKPKKILGELAPLIIDKLINTDPKEIFHLAESVSGGLKQKDIQMYFSSGELEDFVLARNWGGELKAAPGSDFLSVNSTNIGGGKTDNVIRQKIYQTAEIQPDGSVIGRVLIERRNIGPTDDYFTTIANNSYLRIYVPEGSELIHAQGFDGFSEEKFKTLAANLNQKNELAGEAAAVIDPDSGTRIYQENGKTVFANWSVAGPGEKREVLVVYKLPFKVALRSGAGLIDKLADYFSPSTAAYSLKFEKQSGRSADEITSEIIYPNGFNLKSAYPATVKTGATKVALSGLTDTDKFLFVSFTKK